MDTAHVAVDGWVDAIPAPGPRGTATFDLIVRPADADTAATDTPDTVVSCTSGAPQIIHALLTDIQPGDLLRVTGMLVHPQVPGEAAWLTVHGLEVLDTALIPVTGIPGYWKLRNGRPSSDRRELLVYDSWGGRPARVSWLPPGNSGLDGSRRGRA
ncbi:hypothetical protein ACFTY8_46980 [Streptomyces mirabilis]|uniref:hypothetical protein n=1 Tax=Streptomyces mirabilis TaxID=68239 RepID=UPI0036376BD1